MWLPGFGHDRCYALGSSSSTHQICTYPYRQAFHDAPLALVWIDEGTAWPEIDQATGRCMPRWANLGESKSVPATDPKCPASGLGADGKFHAAGPLAYLVFGSPLPASNSERARVSGDDGRIEVKTPVSSPPSGIIGRKKPISLREAAARRQES